MSDDQPFIDYWDAVDAALTRFFGIDTADTGMDADRLAEAQQEGWTPEELARWYGEKHDLHYLDDRKAFLAPPIQAIARLIRANTGGGEK